MRRLMLRLVGRFYSWLGKGLNNYAGAEFEFPCKDRHDDCQKTADKLREKNTKCQASFDRERKWKILGDHQVMNLQKELQKERGD